MKEDKKDYYPEPTCMICSKECTTWEVVDTGDYEIPEELWCWCHDCQIDTFHHPKNRS